MNKIFRSIRNFFTGRIFLSLLCLGVAVFFSFVALPQMYKAQEATKQMTRVKLSLGAGDQIEARHLEFVEVGSYNIPAAALVYQEDVIGKYARVTMFPGDFVFQEKISDFRIDPSYDNFLASGQVLVTITPKNAAQTVSSHLAPGDTVAIATVTEERQPGSGEIKRTVSYPENLSNLTVFDVENARGMSLSRTETQSNIDDVALSSASASQEDLIPRTVTFVVTEEQAKALLEAEYGQALHLIFKNRRP